MAKDFYGDEIPPGGHEISKLWLAMKALDRREFDECLGYCNAVLEKNPYDQVRPPPRSFSSLDADFHHPSHPSDLVPPLHPFPSQQVWYVKTRCLTLKMWVDDTELEEEVRPSPTVPSPPRPVFPKPTSSFLPRVSWMHLPFPRRQTQGVAEVLMDENATAAMPRPGTSLRRPGTRTQTGMPNQGIRPTTSSGRPMTGFLRPGTSNRPVTGAGGIEGAFRGARPGTTRPVTTSGRMVRLGTASMRSEPGGPFINVDKLDLRKYAKRPALAKVLCDYILYHDNNPRKAVELASLATVSAGFNDWWWKERLGKGYYRLGMFRDAEKQFKSSLAMQPTIDATLQLANVYIRLDQPASAIRVYRAGQTQFPGETSMLLGEARIHDALNDMAAGVALYKNVLQWDATCVEAIACMGAHHFYTDQPEIALRFYRRLLMMGVNNTELWNNLGLCCFYASQYDMTLHCFDRALQLADDENMADVWFNVGQVAIGIGDLNLAQQAFKIAVSVDANHSESFNNMGVLDLRAGKVDQATASFETAHELLEFAHEPLYNAALTSFKLGQFQRAFEKVEKALENFPEHEDSLELKKQLAQHFNLL